MRLEKLKRLNPYHLTALHEGWGWGLRTVEIVGQTLSLLILGPLQLLWRGLDWLMSKVLP